MYQELEKWINNLQLQTIPEEIEGFCFNLYDGCGGENWRMDLIGASSFDDENEDWACEEISDFNSRNPLFSWKQNAEWDKVLTDVMQILGRYLKEGKYAGTLTSRTAVAVGFDHGSLEILFRR